MAERGSQWRAIGVQKGHDRDEQERGETAVRRFHPRLAVINVLHRKIQRILWALSTAQ